MLDKLGLPSYPPEIEGGDRLVPRWACHTIRVALSVLWMTSDRDVKEVAAKLRSSSSLRAAVDGAFRMGATGVDVFMIVQEWEDGDE